MEKVLTLILKVLKILDLQYRPQNTIDLLVYVIKIGGLMGTIYMLLKFKTL